ncbi:hypothetical protein PP641_gp075 [Arthrobacter phage SilentRX]|uniref:Uncharacterized protein n=1 Tax=Arthrobacter phage SilentRX TaxID=2836091 RepID=A0A8F3E9X3_9CAUD|nr:hypothetical protein PP641_gp075 [Arthrobacter phage SilentRX]QWY82815.1 hypothetical protein SEA_SILENTRX_75 [Arthrobacter phage SilentRX]
MLNGYRNGIMVMRRIAELLEKHPDVEIPRVKFDSRHVEGETKVTCEVLFHVFGKPDYKLYYAEREESVRLDIERRMQQLIAALGPDAEWTANDPSSESSYDRNYFILTAELDGCEVKLLTDRSAVGEEVTVADAGPDVTEVDGAIRVIRQTATMWRPNITLTTAAPVKFELPSGEIKQLTA